MKVAVYGKLRAGKTAVCDYIKDTFDCEVIEFSTAVQEVVDITYPEYLGIKNRDLLIGIGQSLRKYDSDIWVNIVKRKIQETKKPHILVSGVRQQNEYDMLKKLGFTFIQVEASESTRIERCLEAGDEFTTETLRNPTEMVLDNWNPDYLIINERGFKELEISIKNTMEDIINKELKCSFINDRMENFSERVGVELCK